MSVKASFPDLTFEKVEGYRISMCMLPTDGTMGEFYVYLWDRIDADRPFSDAIKLGERGRRKQGKLTIGDGNREYTFENILLNHFEAGATRRERYRFCEFKYNRDDFDMDPSPAKLSYKQEDPLEDGGLKDDYKYNVDGGANENLLGFRAHVGANEATVLRFSAVRNNKNSFLEKLVEVNASRARDGKMPKFDIGFSQAPNSKFEITQDNLLRVYACESYGELRRLPLPRLSDYLRDAGADILTRVWSEDLTSLELLDHDATKDLTRAAWYPQTVEVATVVIKPGVLREIELK